MKIAANRSIWPLRARVSARHVEFACWLVALVLAIALVTSRPTAADTTVQPTTVAASASLTSSTVFATQEVGVFPRRCVRRIIDLMPQLSQVELVNEIERQCFTQPTRRSLAASRINPSPSPACIRGFGLPAAFVRPVTGCRLD
jgi:hypothetical protein